MTTAPIKVTTQTNRSPFPSLKLVSYSFRVAARERTDRDPA
jgi:hypothetical protein